MRLSRSDRRSLENALRKRLAPRFKLAIGRQLAIAVTATVWLSAEAAAQIASGQASLSFEATAAAEYQDDSVREYSQEELKKGPPEAAKSLEESLGNQLVEVIKSIGGSKKIGKHQSSEQSTSDYFVRASAGLDPSATSSVDSNSDAVRENMADRTSSGAADHYIKKLDVWKKVRKGFNFKLDFGKLFGKSEKPELTQEKNTVRYGLILKSVELENNPDKYRAAVSTMEEELRYAGTAEVEWTIGPIDGNERSSTPTTVKSQRSHRKPVSVNSVQGAAESNQDLSDELIDPDAGEELEETDEDLALEEPAPTAVNIWESGEGVDPAFDGAIKPGSMDASNFLKGDGGKGGLVFSLTQSQGLYQLTHNTGAQGAKDGESSHLFNIPIYGTLSLGRRYDDKMQVVSTSANDILISKRAPSLSIHYAHDLEQYVADARYNTDDNTSLSAQARTEVAEDKIAEKKRKRKHENVYQVGISKKF